MSLGLFFSVFFVFVFGVGFLFSVLCLSVVASCFVLFCLVLSVSFGMALGVLGAIFVFVFFSFRSRAEFCFVIVSI